MIALVTKQYENTREVFPSRGIPLLVIEKNTSDVSLWLEPFTISGAVMRPPQPGCVEP
jgi:hypothetical protein